jgi:hypothetical protein
MMMMMMMMMTMTRLALHYSRSGNISAMCNWDIGWVKG